MSKSKQPVLFLTAPIGSGHTRAAQAMAAALGDRCDNVEPYLLNIFDFINPKLVKLFLNSYYKILETVPCVYGLAYGWGNSSSGALWGRELVSRYFADKISGYISRLEPSAVVCTHATPAGLMSYLAGKGISNVPVYAVITDFVVHRLWVYPQIQRYFVADDYLRGYLRQEGATGDIHITGIPVHKEFAEEYDKLSLRKKLGLDPVLPTVLIMGGGIGLLPIGKLVKTCLKSRLPLQVIVVAGKNRSAYNEAASLASDSKAAIKVYGYIDNVHELMACSDIVVTKPGGMSSSEAICTGLPMLIYRPIPGQEEANTSYLLQRGLAVRIDSLTDLEAKLNGFVEDKGRGLDAIRKQMANFRKPRAAEEIAAIIASDLNFHC